MKIRRAVALLLLAAQTGACTSIRPVLEPTQFITRKQPTLVWVVDASDESIPLTGPSLRSDSIFGLIGNSSEPYGIPLSQTRRILARQPDKQKTMLLIGGLTVAVGLGAYMFANMGDGPKADCFFPDKVNRC